MNDQEFHDRVGEVLREELDTPEAWQYVSFADDTGFKGVVFIKAHGVTDALMKINLLQINPHGEVMCVEYPIQMVLPLPEDRNRLLSLEDVMRIWPDSKSLEELEAEEKSET